MAKFLVTGAAGFIGYHFSKRLLANGNEVAGLDSLNDFYDERLRHDRLRQHMTSSVKTARWLVRYNKPFWPGTPCPQQHHWLLPGWAEASFTGRGQR